MDLLMVWTQLSDRLSQTRESVFEADLLLKAIKLSISTMRSEAILPDGRYACCEASIAGLLHLGSQSTSLSFIECRFC
jgi:hypothetical protein